MANRIEDYRRTDLSDVGQRIKALSGASNATIIDSLVGIGLQIAQNAYLDKKAESKEGFVTAMKSTSDALKSLDHTQSGIELEDASGNTYDAYNKQYELVETSLKNLSEFQDDPALKKQRGEINRVLNEFTQIFAHKDAMKNQREEYLDDIEALGTDYMNLVKADPSLTNPDDWKATTEIIKDLELGYANLLANSGKKIPAAKAMEYQNLLQINEMILRAREADGNKFRKGFQVDLTAKGSPYLQSFFEKMGMKQEYESSPVSVATYMPELADTAITTGEDGLPAGGMMVDGEWIGSAQQLQYKAPDTAQYKDALRAFDKFQLIDIAREADKLVKKEAASDMRSFEVMRDWTESGNSTQILAGLYTGHEVFGDRREDNPWRDLLSHQDPDELKYIDDTIVPDFNNMHMEGLNAAQFEKMQTDYIDLEKNYEETARRLKEEKQKQQGKTIDDLDDVESQNIRMMSDNLNKEIVRYNKRSDSDIITVHDFKDNTSSTKGAKSLHVNVLQSIIDADHSEEWSPGSAAWQEEPELKKFQDAAGIAKWSAMRKLVEKYLDAEGEPTNQALAIEIWDAEGLLSGEGQERYDLFYATLRSFRELMLADPYGTLYTAETAGDEGH